MADITSNVLIEGGNQANDRPVSWHTWRVTVPATALAGAGPDDILLPGRFRNGSRLFDVRVQKLVAATAATSLDMDVEQVLVADIGGAVTGNDNIFAAIDLTTVDLEGNGPVMSTSTDYIGFGDAVDDTNKRAVNLELTKVGAISGADAVFEVTVLIIRNEY